APGPARALPAHEAPPASERVVDRARVHALRGDVDAILAKALQREPEARYATVDAMADDVRRHLEGEPVSARTATASYRLRKFVGGHTTAVAAGATMALAAIVATIVIVVQTERATTEAEEAELVKQFAIEAFRASVQDEEGDDPSGPSSFERLLERNAQLIERAGAPRLQAQLYGIVADILLDATRLDPAAKNARRQIALLEQLDAPPAERVAPTLLLSRALLGGNAVQDAELEARHALAGAQAAADRILEVRARLQLSEA